MSSTITNNHNSLVTNLRNQLLKSFSTLPPPPTSIYRVSLPIDDMTLALLLPPHPMKENQERVILSPVESHNNTSFLSNKSKEGCDNAHEDLQRETGSNEIGSNKIAKKRKNDGRASIDKTQRQESKITMRGEK